MHFGRSSHTGGDEGRDNRRLQILEKGAGRLRFRDCPETIRWGRARPQGVRSVQGEDGITAMAYLLPPQDRL